MASKARGGMSKREFAAASKPKPKAVVRSTASKAPAPLKGAGPLMPGQSRVANSYSGGSAPLKGAGPLLPGQNRVENSYTGSKPKTQSKPKQSFAPLAPKQSAYQAPQNNRSMASQAFNFLTGTQPAQASEGEDAPSIEDTIPEGDRLKPTQTRGGFASDLFRGATNVAKNLPFVGPAANLYDKSGFDLSSALGIDNLLSQDSGFATSANEQAKYQYIPKDVTPDVPTSYGDSGQQFFNDYKPNPRANRPVAQKQDQVFQGPETKDQYKQGKDLDLENQNRLIDLAERTKAMQGDVTNMDIQNQGFDPSEIDRMVADKNKRENPDLNFTPLGAQNFSYPEPTAYQSPVATIKNKSGRGSGDFGNGKMTSSAGLTKEEKQYIDELRASAQGDYGAGNIQSSYQALIDALNPAYDLQQKTAEEEMNKAKNEDIQKLAGMFASNNTAGSEQQQQYTQRTQGDYAGQLAKMLTNLAQNKNQDVANYQSKMQGQLADVAQQKQTAQQRMLDMIRQVQEGAATRGQRAEELAYQRNQDYISNQRAMANDSFDQNYKMASLNQKADTGYTPAQQQKILGTYQNDLDKTLKKYAQLGAGQFGREKAANELIKRYGTIFDPQSIMDEVMQTATPGWEQSPLYRQV